ncbi:MAG TPA: hypothetical protein ENF73_02670, partial [Proteobacteria bacterium]|nr:hypothetical protein [Pseudomonadota bacterium]
MLRTLVVSLCICSLAIWAHASIPLSRMSRVDSVELDRIRTEFTVSVVLKPSRGISGCRAYSVNGGSIILVTLPRTYVDPPVRDFGINNDWIESISAHQV